MKEVNKMTIGEIGQAVESLRYGKSFVVGTENERQQALNAARYLRKRITSRKNGKGGFQIIALE